MDVFFSKKKKRKASQSYASFPLSGQTQPAFFDKNVSTVYTPCYTALQRLSAVTMPTLKLRKRPSKFCIRWDFVVTANLTQLDQEFLSQDKGGVIKPIFSLNSIFIKYVVTALCLCRAV